jgi:hypothetical protein
MEHSVYWIALTSVIFSLELEFFPVRIQIYISYNKKKNEC